MTRRRISGKEISESGYAGQALTEPTLDCGNDGQTRRYGRSARDLAAQGEFQTGLLIRAPAAGGGACSLSRRRSCGSRAVTRLTRLRPYWPSHCAGRRLRTLVDDRTIRITIHRYVLIRSDRSTGIGLCRRAWQSFPYVFHHFSSSFTCGSAAPRLLERAPRSPTDLCGRNQPISWVDSWVNRDAQT